ncbi:splicing factor U2af large subunit A protein [Pleurostoma richardsiae]|uniref:Splicing factor U2af large subunit A protein n=1 Tax=Pleurostoma richardsiae TaxID=41990 RepID=A0AA38VNQ6_9PEZI|nr:splicing factor U2af large subunit A protein [Pleurostoma richardsiae]
MACGPHTLSCLWQEERIREKLLSLLAKEDICSVRLTSSASCSLYTKQLFTRTHLTFTANAFTKPCRIRALSRIGHHVEHLTFYFPHSEATFLPPLIHPSTGHEISYLYTPHTSAASVRERPRYGDTELGDILTQQYPPLFHAATNVPSFINAIKHLPNVRHLTVRTPGQNPRERYRRDIVDYALISLRIALERAPMTRLATLSLSVHPAAFSYLRYVHGFGCLPSAGKRWKQIRHLHISVDSWDFHGPSPGLDQLRIIGDYIRQFAPQLETLTFAWLGSVKGPWPLARPLALPEAPLDAPSRSITLSNDATSPVTPLPLRPARKPIIFPKLRYLQLCNAAVTAPQMADLVGRHRGSVREFGFEEVALFGGGRWDEVLAPPVRGGSPEARVPETPVAMHSDEFESIAAATSTSKDLLDLDVDELAEYVGVGSSPGTDAVVEGASESVIAEKNTRRRRRMRKPWHPKQEQGLLRRHEKADVRHRQLRHGREVYVSQRRVSGVAYKAARRDESKAAAAAVIVRETGGVGGSGGDEPTGVQRNLEQEDRYRLLAEDSVARATALRQAQAAVLAKLDRQCGRRAARGRASSHGKRTKSLVVPLIVVR